MKKDKQQIKMIQIAFWNAIAETKPAKKNYWIKRYLAAIRLAKVAENKFVRGYYQPKKTYIRSIQEILDEKDFGESLKNNLREKTQK